MSAEHRIIVCDDQRDTAITLALLLRTYGYEVFSCFDGESCLEKAKAWAPYAAIIDLGLPRMTGYAVARALRALPSRENLLLIAVTAYDKPEYVEEAKLAGFDWHFRKPAPPSSIIGVLRHPSRAAQEGTRLA
jgi:CheY-like chemotaxis protein